MVSLADEPTIVGDRVVLRPLVAPDADAMWADLHDPESVRLTGTHARFTRDRIDDPPVNRLSLEVFAFNARAAAVYEEVGFRR